MGERVDCRPPVKLYMGGGRRAARSEGVEKWAWGETTFVSSRQTMDEDAFTDGGNQTDRQARICWYWRQGDVVDGWRERCRGGYRVDFGRNNVRFFTADDG